MNPGDPLLFSRGVLYNNAQPGISLENARHPTHGSFDVTDHRHSH